MNGDSLLRKKTLTAIEVRDAVVDCFFGAHIKEIESALEGMNTTEEQKKEAIREMVKKAFLDTGGDFEKPTKRSILSAMNQLRGMAKFFRDQDTIKKNYEHMLSLLHKVS